MLLDGQGNDIYSAGGKYKHAPLVPDDFRSLGQGFGFGMRPDFAGGIGVLCDLVEMIFTMPEFMRKVLHIGMLLECY